MERRIDLERKMKPKPPGAGDISGWNLAEETTDIPIFTKITTGLGIRLPFSEKWFDKAMERGKEVVTWKEGKLGKKKEKKDEELTELAKMRQEIFKADLETEARRRKEEEKIEVDILEKDKVEGMKKGMRGFDEEWWLKEYTKCVEKERERDGKRREEVEDTGLREGELEVDNGLIVNPEKYVSLNGPLGKLVFKQLKIMVVRMPDEEVARILAERKNEKVVIAEEHNRTYMRIHKEVTGEDLDPNWLQEQEDKRAEREKRMRERARKKEAKKNKVEAQKESEVEPPSKESQEVEVEPTKTKGRVSIKDFIASDDDDDEEVRRKRKRKEKKERQKEKAEEKVKKEQKMERMVVVKEPKVKAKLAKLRILDASSVGLAHSSKNRSQEEVAAYKAKAEEVRMKMEEKRKKALEERRKMKEEEKEKKEKSRKTIFLKELSCALKSTSVGQRKVEREKEDSKKRKMTKPSQELKKKTPPLSMPVVTGPNPMDIFPPVIPAAMLPRFKKKTENVFNSPSSKSSVSSSSSSSGSPGKRSGEMVPPSPKPKPIDWSQIKVTATPQRQKSPEALVVTRALPVPEAVPMETENSFVERPKSPSPPPVESPPSPVKETHRPTSAPVNFHQDDEDDDDEIELDLFADADDLMPMDDRPSTGSIRFRKW